MDVYVFQAALLCESCGEAICAKLNRNGVDSDRVDSDSFPKGPYGNGGGEADTPQHCDACGVFLENPLTDGRISSRGNLADYFELTTTEARKLATYLIAEADALERPDTAL